MHRPPQAPSQGSAERIHANQVSGADYSQLADNMNTPFAHIVANCKLPAEADAQLHIVLANMMQGVDTIQGKTGDQQPEQSVTGMKAGKAST